MSWQHPEPFYVKREEMYERAFLEPLGKIANDLGVSDSWLGRKYREAGIPLPGRGYWARLGAGKADRPPLPPLKPGQSESVLIRTANTRHVLPQEKDQISALVEASSFILIPRDLSNLRPIVEETRSIAMSAPENEVWLDVPPTLGGFHLLVSRMSLPRSLLIIQAIVDWAALQGWSVQSRKVGQYSDEVSTCIAAGRHQYEVRLRERAKTAKRPSPGIGHGLSSGLAGDETGLVDAEQLLPTGILSLILPRTLQDPTRSWTDTKSTKIEEMLGEVFATVQFRMQRDEAYAQQKDHEEADRNARRREAAITRKRVERLENEVSAFGRAEVLRTYASALRERLVLLEPGEAARLSAYCDWLDSYWETVDPTRNTKRIVGINDEEDSKLYE